MDQLGVRDLRNQTASAVRRAAAGERIVVTVTGRPMAQLGPLDPFAGGATLADLASRGLVVAARRADRPAPDVRIDLWAGARLDRAVAELRGG